MNDAPLARPYNLARLPQAGETLELAASEAERAALAHWADLLLVEKWEATVALKKRSPSRFVMDARLMADIVQACVVTLRPVPARIERSFTRELHFTGVARRRPARGPEEPRLDLPPILAEEDAPDEIESLHYDLAGPLLEEFSLAIDPYPRAPGVEFVAPADPPDSPKSPFQVLGKLKSRR